MWTWLFLTLLELHNTVTGGKVHMHQRHFIRKTTTFHAFEYTNLTFSHAESPVWDDEANVFYWVDVHNQNVHALDYKTREHRVKHIEYGEMNVVVPVANSSRLLVGVRSELFLLDWDKPGDSALRLVAALEVGKPNNVLNEGKADARGRFWGGTKGLQRGDNVTSHEGALYSVEKPHCVPQVHLKPVSISNGLVWALNNSILYYIDSNTKRVEAFDYDLQKGLISNRRTITDITDYGFHEAVPDGMTIDRDGHLWVALMFNGSVIRIEPDSGRIKSQYKLPVSRVTSVAWAGAAREVLMVTSSRRSLPAARLAAEPLAGAVFTLHRLGTGGVPDHKFQFENADDY